ncbi:MAG: protein kinase [Alistipes sp.]|nr:protein kinase [Alistipes sp.]
MNQEEFIRRFEYNPVSDLLGEGGFGRVYKAYDRYEHEYVALKIQSVDPHHPDIRLRNEVDKVQQHLHKNIARYKGCYTFTDYRGETDIAVMKYYPDGSLDKLMAKINLTSEQIYSILTEILEGVDYLHSVGIIHRDLKPQNVLIVEHGGQYSPLITDFGISKQLGDGESSAVSNSVLGGTRAYASPEQLKETTIRKNTDLWSFGVIAYQMLVGELPFNAGTLSPTSEEGRQEQFRQMMSGILPELLCHVPEPWQRLIRECLIVDNTKRLAHVSDCMEILNSKAVETTPHKNIQLDKATVLEHPTPQPVEPKQEQEYIPDSNSDSIHQPPKPADKKSKRNNWWWFLLLACIIGGLIWIVYEVSTLALETEPPYIVGDYYNENGKQGVVFEVWDGGRHGKIVSLDETQAAWDSRAEDGNSPRTYADSKSDGKANTDKIMSRSDSQYFDAFEWCRAKGSSWYLPAHNELQKIYNNKSTLNTALQKYGTTLNNQWYWTSTEYVDSEPEFCAWLVSVYGGYTYNGNKDYDYYVRAVSTF